MRSAAHGLERRAITPTGEQTNMRSQPKILHYANVEDEATDSAYEVFRFYKVDGGRGTAQIPRQSAFDPKEVRKELLRRNANLPLDEKAALKLICAAIEAEPRLAQLHCEATGWRGFDAFVTPSRVIDTRQRERILLPPMRLSKEQRRRQASAGSLVGCYPRDLRLLGPR